MKSLIYLFISIVIAITLTSAVQKTSDSSKSIILQSTAKNTGSATLKQSADIISTRLKLYGLSSFEVKVSAEKGRVIVLLSQNTDISGIEGLLTSRGDLAFYETYTQIEITDLLKPDNQLFKLLNHDQENKPNNPKVGCTGNENRTRVDEYLRLAVPPRNCKLLWSLKSEKSGYCLFALKTGTDGKPLLIGSDVESVKIDSAKGAENTKIQIKLKSASASLFADATKNNLNKSIAIVIDDQVYSWPEVRSAIEGGEVEISGNFTAKEVKYFPVIFNSGQLPLSFKIVK